MGLSAGLDEAREAIALVTAGDAPDLVPEVLELLLAALRDPATTMAVLADGDRPTPFPMAIRRDAGRDATARLVRSGERRLSALIEALGAAVIEEARWRARDPLGRTVRDIDTPDDLP